MKQTKIQISIPEPCSVPWDSMTKIDEKKRHCSSCEKIIYDFTKMSDAELVKFLSTNGKICGQFTAYQLNRNLLPAEINRSKKWPLALLISSVLFAIKSPARNPEKTTGIQTEQSSFRLEKEAGISAAVSRTIEGTVIDSLSNDSLIGALVWIELKGKQYRSETDLNGKFSIVLPEMFQSDSAVLHARYVGYEEFTLLLDSLGENPVLKMRFIVQDVQTITSTDRDDVMVVGRIVRPVVKGNMEYMDATAVRHSRFRSFFYRLFHPRRFRH